MNAARPGDPAPPFSLPLVGGGYRGLADLVEPGGGALLFFKASCETCRLVLPRLGPLAAALEREGRLFLAVGQEDEPETRAFAAEHALPYRVAWDGAPHAASAAYAVTVVPTLLLVDGAGVVAERLEGFVKHEYLALGPAAEAALALGDAPPVLDGAADLPDLKPG